MNALNLRVAPALKSEASAYAESLGISFNALVAVALRDYLDARKSLGSQPAQSDSVEQQRATPTAPAPASTSEAGRKVVQLSGKVGRNEPCPCGSGKKWKQCHGVAA
ncbi:SEC-C metal-binding domain-containing protein [Lysobacter sp. F6437]|uniref:SEC-C metal-binding domain-containing protein n=1 Tax=Lysobacter sp. F6437 TaxID=3459296 RepID=UPI00403D981B